MAGGKQLLAAAGGMGGKRAAAAAAALIREWRPDLLVMAGVAGALAPSLQIGDVIAADVVCAGHELLTPSTRLRVPNHPHHPGALLSVDRVLVTSAEKQAACRAPDPSPPHTTPLAVEMETAAVARVAIELGTAWAAVRSVSDTADESLPLDFNRLRTPDGDLPVSRVAMAAVARPQAIPGLLRLGRNTSAAAGSLACFVEQWLQQI